MTNTEKLDTEKLNTEELNSLNLDKFFENKDVEWVNLSEVAKVVKGKHKFTKETMVEGGIYPAMNGGMTPSGYVNEFNRNENTIIISQSGSAGYVNYMDTKFWLGGDAFSIEPKEEFVNKNNLNPYSFNKLLFYVLKQNEKRLQGLKAGGIFKRIYAPQIEKVKVPLLSSNDLEKLVDFLDKCCQLINNLQVNIVNNNKQYIYYRNYLLSREILEQLNSEINGNNTTIESCTFKDLVQFRSGSDVRKFATSDENSTIAVFGGSGKQKLRVNEFAYDKTTVIIPQTGDLDLAWFVEEPFWAMNSSIYTVFKTDTLLPKYYYYVVKSKRLSRFNIYGTRPTLNHTVLNKIPMDLPPLNVQQKIVDILDKFENLDQNLTQELEARIKQYEYYRREILNYFKPAE